MSRPGVRKEVARIEREEGVLLDLLLKARHEAGLTQAHVAERIERLARALVAGKHSPSSATLRKYVVTTQSDPEAAKPVDLVERRFRSV